MTHPEIKGFIETSFCDWDGCLASVIFLPYCNLRCPYCQNGILISEPETIPNIDLDAILASLERRRGWIDGVVITGGEPTIHADLADLARTIKMHGFKVKIDTNGTNPDLLCQMVKTGLVDYIAMDVKAPIDDRYSIAAGVKVDLRAISRSIEILLNGDLPYELRTTLVPGIIDQSAIESISSSIRGAKKYVLQRFVPDNSLDSTYRNLLPFSDDFVAGLLDIARRHVENAFYRGKSGVALSSKGGLA